MLVRLACKEKSLSQGLLTINALEMREDLYLSQIAEKIDQKDAKRYEHSKAWK